jgi:hypothetical protein
MRIFTTKKIKKGETCMKQRKFLKRLSLIPFILLFLLISFFITSCSPPISSTAETSFSETSEEFQQTKPISPFNISLEPNKDTLPSYEILKQIVPGMSATEVFEIAGNPQRTETRTIPYSEGTSLTMPSTCYIYDSSDGMSISVSFHVEKDTGIMFVHMVFDSNT